MGEMSAFVLVIRLLAPITILAGFSHVVLGLNADVLLGANAPAELRSDPVLDSQNRFYGTIFMGYGVLLFLCATDLRKYALLFRILGGFIFLGGIARLISAALHGLPAPPVVGLIVIELVVVPLLLWWHSKVLSKQSTAVT